MTKLTIIGTALVIVVTLLAAIFTYLHFGSEDFEEPQGLSLRQESERSGGHGFFFLYTRTRSHSGGGLSGGK
jgi:hypothetical protein